MNKCSTCNRETPEEDLFPYHSWYVNQETGQRRVTGSDQTCSRCLALKQPDTNHPPFERSPIPPGFREAFPDGELPFPDEVPEPEPPASPYYYQE